VNRTDGADLDAEAARVGRVYAGYRRSPRRRRAWAAENPGNVAMREELFERVRAVAAAELAGEAPILDAGCGGGYWLSRIADAGVAPSRLHGVDILAERVASARASLPVAARQGDVRALPYRDGEFGLVLMFTVLSSLGSSADVRLALREAQRVLRPGGLVLVYEPRVPQPFNRRIVHVSAGDVREVLGPPVHIEGLTVLPPLARRLGRFTGTLYPRLRRIAALRTHRLFAHRRPL
jgi:SAM-dependent methyltransferase